MRISDWSSDVCSSDLLFIDAVHCIVILAQGMVGITTARPMAQGHRRGHAPFAGVDLVLVFRNQPAQVEHVGLHAADRKSVGEGKSVSVRVDLGGRLIIKKKTQKTEKTHQLD